MILRLRRGLPTQGRTLLEPARSIRHERRPESLLACYPETHPCPEVPSERSLGRSTPAPGTAQVPFPESAGLTQAGAECR